MTKYGSTCPRLDGRARRSLGRAARWLWIPLLWLTFSSTAAAACSFSSVSGTGFWAWQPDEFFVLPSGGSGSLTINFNGAGCSWAVSFNGNVPLTFTTPNAGSFSNGPATVGLMVSATASTSPLFGTLTIAVNGSSVWTESVGQNSPNCAIGSFTPPSASYGTAGGSGSVTVNMSPSGADCWYWFTYPASWVTVPSGLISGYTINYSVASNSGPPQSTSIAFSQPSSAAFTISQAGVIPNITTVTPMPVTAGGPTFTLTVNGTGFVAGESVNWNGSPLTTTFVSSVQMTATVPASDIVTAGTANITVAWNTGTSNTYPLPVIPSITSVSPASVIAGSAGFTLTVNGTGFTSGSVVYWGGQSTPLTTTYVSSTEITASVPASLVMTPGSVGIFAASQGYTSQVPPPSYATVTINPPPAITSLSPSSATAGAAGFTLTVNGSNFAANAVVQWNGSALTTSYQSASVLTATVPASLVQTAGSASVTVVMGGITSAVATFPINPAPSITSLSPSNAVAGGTGFTLTVNGSNFASNAVVQWNGSALTTNYQSATQLTAVVTAPKIASAGTATVTVLSGGVTSSGATFTITSGSAVFSLNTPTSATFGSSGGNGSEGVTVTPSTSTASWGVISNNTDWITITSPACNTGDGAITYAVKANTGGNRQGSFSLLSGCSGAAGTTAVGTFTITQQPPTCVLSATPTSFTFAAGAGSGTLTPNIPPCTSWSATSNEPWVTFSNGSETAGGTNASIVFNVGANTGSQRSATITVGSQQITVMQNAPVCTYSVGTAAGSNPNFLAAGGTGSIQVSTNLPSGCPWTASSNNSFLTISSGSSGNGPGTVNYSVQSNTTSAKQSGSITVNGSTYIVNQAAAGISQSLACRIASNQPQANTLRQEGLTELLADLVMTCSGSSSAGITGDVTVNLNANLTNRLLSSDPSGITTDALLLIDDPAGNALVLNTNVFRGIIVGPKAIRFPSVPLAAAAGTFSHTVRITNLRVDANHLSTLSPPVSSVSATVALSVAGAGVPAAQFLGTIAPSTGFSAPAPAPGGPGGSSVWSLTFAQQFNNAYRPAEAAGQDPSQAGTVYPSESGYVNSQVLGTETGFATNGTRLVARFTGVPCSVQLFAPVSPTAGNDAELVSADGNGVGGFPVVVLGSLSIGTAQVSGYQPVQLTTNGGTCSGTGSGSATWEVTSTSSMPSLTFNVYVYNPGNVSLSGIAVSPPGGPAPQQAISAPAVGESIGGASIPRFANTTIPLSSPVDLSVFPNLSLLPASNNESQPAVADGQLAALVKLLPLTSSGSQPCTSQTNWTATNTSTANAGNVTMTVSTSDPGAITDCQADSNGTAQNSASSACSCTWSSVAPDQVTNCAPAVTSPTCPANGYQWNISVTSNQGNDDPNGSASMVITTPLLVITQSPSSGTLPQGAPASIALEVDNHGVAAAVGTVQLTETAPPELTQMSITPGPGTVGWSCTGLTCTNTVSIDNTDQGNQATHLTLNFTVTDSDNAPSTTNTVNVSLNGYALTPSTAPIPLELNNLVIQSPSPGTALSGGTVGQAYSVTFSVTGGVAPYGWSATGLPNGLSMSSAGTLSGTPTSGGTNLPITVMVHDSSQLSTSANYTLTITTAGLQLTCPALPAGTVGVAYTGVTCAASAGAPPYSFAWSGTTPPGLTIGPTSGAISGTPTTAGAYSNITITVTDSSKAANSGNSPYSITIASPPALSISKSHTGNFTAGQQGAAYTLKVSNAIGTEATSGTVTVTDTVPSGLTLVSMAGTGWTCPNGGASATCTRSDALLGGGSYPAITVTVNVAGSAPSQVTNQASVSGGGSGQASASDPTVIQPVNATCSFTLTPTSASLSQNGTASSGGVLPEVPVTVGISLGVGATCSPSFTVTSSASWLSATGALSGLAYTAQTNPHPSSRSATLTLTNAGGGSATFTVTEAGDPEPLLNRQVRALYQSVLGRDPDPSGFAFWTGSGEAGLGQMLDSFLTSPEAYDSDFAVMAAYQAATGTVPTYAQFISAVAAVRAGTSAGSLFSQLLPASYSVQNLYQNLLQRAPTAAEINSANSAGLAAWFAALIAYPSSVTPVTAPNNEFMNTGTFQTSPDHTNGLYVAMLYFVILGRDLDPSGYGFWVGVANSGGPGILFQGAAGYPTRIQILGPGTPGQGFAGSPEFQGLYQ